MTPDPSADRPEEILAAVRAAAAGERPLDVDEPEVKLVVFRLAESLWAFRGDEVDEILPMPAVTAVPGVPPAVSGVFNLRGAVESLVDIRSVLGCGAAEETEQSRVLLVHAGNIRSGVLADEVRDVPDVPESALTPPLDTLDDRLRPLVRGHGYIGGEPVPLLDPEALFRALFPDYWGR